MCATPTPLQHANTLTVHRLNWRPLWRMPENRVQWRPLQRMPETALVVQFHAEGRKSSRTNKSLSCPSPSLARSSRNSGVRRDMISGVNTTPYCSPDMPSASRLRTCACRSSYIRHRFATLGFRCTLSVSYSCRWENMILSGLP